MKIYLLLIPILILSGCTIDWRDEKDKKIEELEKQIQNDTFKKKQECIKFEPEMRKQLESYERYSDREDWTTLYLSEVFYSPSRETCLFKSEFIYWDSEEKTYVLEINDYFTKEIVFEKICQWSKKEGYNNYSQCSETFASKVQELKWE